MFDNLAVASVLFEAKKHLYVGPGDRPWLLYLCHAIDRIRDDGRESLPGLYLNQDTNKIAVGEFKEAIYPEHYDQAIGLLHGLLHPYSSLEQWQKANGFSGGDPAQRVRIRRRWVSVLVDNLVRYH